MVGFYIKEFDEVSNDTLEKGIRAIDVIAKMLGDDVEGIKVIFDNEKKRWRVEWGSASEEEW